MWCWRAKPRPATISLVVDDARQGVTDVVRGQDLVWSTSVHRLLQALLGLPVPRYRHHRLLRDADGQKLAKSTRSTSLRALREGGASPQDIRRMVGLA
jgi:glutamyl-Q tRNA(Asp) synthetase